MTNAYSGIKSVGHTVADSVVNNRVVVGLREGQVSKALHSSVDGILSYAETKLDETMPPVKGN